MLPISLYKSSTRFISKNSWQFFSLIAGIVLSVAIITATDIAINSATKSFKLSTEIINGKASHHIISNSEKISEKVLNRLYLNENIAITPIIEDFIVKDEELYKVIGFDPFSDYEFRSISNDLTLKKFNASPFINNLEAFLCSKRTAENLKIVSGDTIEFNNTRGNYPLKLYGILDSGSQEESSSLDNILFVDISTAQELLNLKSYISRIDLILPNNFDTEAFKDKLTKLDESLILIKASDRNESKELMTKSFNTNLSALSLLAMLVGVFLIYNTMTFSVLQRRKIIGIFRAIGSSKNEIFSSIIFESSLLAIIGTILGIGLGIALAKVILDLITRTINDLYFVIQVNQINIDTIDLLKPALIGIFTSIFSAFLPALEASNTPVSNALKEIDIEEKSKKYIPQLNLIALILIVLAFIIFFIFTHNIPLCFLGLFLLVFGCALFIPCLVYNSDFILNFIFKDSLGISAIISARSLQKNLSRNAIAIAALSVSLSLFLSLDIAISSFRNTVEDWLNYSLFADVYISSPKLVSNKNNVSLDNKVISFVKKINSENISEISEYHLKDIRSPDSTVRLASINSLEVVKDSFKFKAPQDEESTKKLWVLFDNKGGLIVSAPYAYKHNVKVGEELKLFTDKGLKSFKILGIFNDYSSDQGLLIMHQDYYRSLWNDDSVSSLGVFIKDKANDSNFIDNFKEKAIQNNIPADSFEIRSNKQLLDESLIIFDRTFRITSVLKFIAIIVAAFGIFNALLALLIERKKEFALLKALGLSDKDIFKTNSIQAISMGILSWLYSIPIGILSAWVMIDVINHRSFGWDIHFSLDLKNFMIALAVSLGCAFLASIYPSLKLKDIPASILLKD